MLWASWNFVISVLDHLSVKEPGNSKSALNTGICPKHRWDSAHTEHNTRLTLEAVWASLQCQNIWKSPKSERKPKKVFFKQLVFGGSVLSIGTRVKTTLLPFTLSVLILCLFFLFQCEYRVYRDRNSNRATDVSFLSSVVSQYKY